MATPNKMTLVCAEQVLLSLLLSGAVQGPELSFLNARRDGRLDLAVTDAGANTV